MSNFVKALQTNEYIFYCDFEECDDNGNTKMYDSNMNLISDNYFANVGIQEELEKIHKNEVTSIFIHGDIANNLDSIVVNEI